MKAQWICLEGSASKAADQLQINVSVDRRCLKRTKSEGSQEFKSTSLQQPVPLLGIPCIQNWKYTEAQAHQSD